MTQDHIDRVVTECERRWRERTPATRPDEINASQRVSRGELRRFAHESGIELDEMDVELQVAMLRLFTRLRREFPRERWDGYNAATRALAKAHGVVLPRLV